MRKYFIHDGQNEIGPFDFEQLKTMQIKNETPIWYEGLQNWTTANNVEELKTIISSTISPPKFEKFTQQNTNTNPPNFSTSISDNEKYITPKKNNTLRNILIGVAISGVLFVGVILFAMSKSGESYNRNDESIQADSIAPAVENESDEINIELTKRNRNYRNNIEQFVEVRTNKYSYNELGGISNLDIIVTNNTEYLLEEVNVAIDYIKDSGGIYKTEIVTIYNIPAKQDKTASAPESDRGTSVNANIQTISSKELHLCYDNTFAPKVGEIDPYFCK